MVNGVGETDRDQIMQALVGSAKDFVFYSKCSGKSSEHIRQGRVIQLVYHLKKKSLWLLCEPEVNEFTMKLMGPF